MSITLVGAWKSNGSASATPITVGVGQTITAGNLLLCTITTAGQTVTSVTDNATPQNTFTLVDSLTSSAGGLNGVTQLFYWCNAAGAYSDGNIIVTLNAGVAYVRVAEYTPSVAGAFSLDGTPTKSTDLGTPATSFSPGSMTASADGLAVNAMITGFTNPSSVDAPFGFQAPLNDGSGYGAGNSIDAATTSGNGYNAVVRCGSPISWILIQALFKQAASSPTIPAFAWQLQFGR